MISVSALSLALAFCYILISYSKRAITSKCSYYALSRVDFISSLIFLFVCLFFSWSSVSSFLTYALSIIVAFSIWTSQRAPIIGFISFYISKASFLLSAWAMPFYSPPLKRAAILDMSMPGGPWILPPLGFGIIGCIGWICMVAEGRREGYAPSPWDVWRGVSLGVPFWYILWSVTLIDSLFLGDKNSPSSTLPST